MLARIRWLGWMRRDWRWNGKELNLGRCIAIGAGMDACRSMTRMVHGLGLLHR